MKPGMTIADVGSGGGAMTVVLGRLIGDGKVFATDITEHALRHTREYVVKEGLKNVTVLEGAAASTNLPAACCDAIFMRDVYHHILANSLDAFTRSVMASLKPGGRLAIIDFAPSPGSKLFPGVPANRGGHGVPIDQAPNCCAVVDAIDAMLALAVIAKRGRLHDRSRLGRSRQSSGAP